MRKAASQVLLAFLIACASAGSPRNPAFDKFPAGINGHTTLIFYDVHGRTFAELGADMHKQGEKTLGGANYVGETRSPMKLQWRVDPTGTSYCTVREVFVSMNSEITLPRWTAPADAEPGLVDEWKRFMSALELHEAGHKDISAKAGREIVRKLNALSESCASIAFHANEVARAIIDRATVEQLAYDASTRHGINQGTSFGRRSSRPAN